MALPLNLCSAVTAAARRQLRGETGNKKSTAEVAAEIRKRMESERLETKDEIVQARALWGKLSTPSLGPQPPPPRPRPSPPPAPPPDGNNSNDPPRASVTEPRIVSLVRRPLAEDRGRGAIGVRLQLTSAGHHRIASVLPDGAAAVSRRGACPRPRPRCREPPGATAAARRARPRAL